LWSLPEVDSQADVETVCRERFGITVTPGAALSPVEHGFSHFRLTIHPQQVQYRATVRIMEGEFAWYARRERPGLPAPIARIVDTPQPELDL
jgi:A/G-specific adenine glycosylase